MSKISIKTDFADGEKLFAQDLNNNFLVIQAGINANEENLQEVIDKAIIELDKQLEEITADRGWDWNGGDRVTFYKGNAQAIEDREIINGQLLYNTDSGETALDDNGTRVVTGSGNVVSISEEEPTNPSTKIWIKPSKMARYAASYVTNDMSGTDTDKAPSVNAVKNYVDTNNRPQLIFCKKSGDSTTTGTYTEISDWAAFYNFGNAFSVQNGKVVVGSNVHHIKVTMKYRLAVGQAQGVYSYLKKNGVNWVPSWTILNCTGDMAMINETIMEVTEGDIITSSYYGNGAIIKSDASALTVEKID